jgi:hypothetical protein
VDFRRIIQFDEDARTWAALVGRASTGSRRRADWLSSADMAVAALYLSAHLDVRMSVVHVPNRMSDGLVGDLRGAMLVAAAYESL